MGHLRFIVTGTGRSGTVGLASLLTDVGFPCSHERFFNGTSLEESLRLMEANDGENSFCSRHFGLPGQTDPVVAESSYMAAPYLDQPSLAGATIIHAVRNPWKVILSFLNHLHFFRGEPEQEHEKFIYSVLPQLHEIDNSVDRAVYYFIHWNRMIETLARKQRVKLHGGFLGLCQRTLQELSRQRRSCYIFHRIEDGPTTLLRKLGLSKKLIRQSQKTNMNAFKDWPRELGSHAPISWVRIEHINASKYAKELRILAKRYGYRAPHSEQSPTKPRSEEADSRGEFEVRFSQVPRLLEAGYRGYNLVRWQTACYALPQGESIDLEVMAEDVLKEKEVRSEIFVAPCLSKLKAKLDEVNRKPVEAAAANPPILIESAYRCFNLVLWRREYYALHQQSLCGLALGTTPETVLKEFLFQGTLLIAPSLREAKEQVDQLVRQHPQLENGQPFGIGTNATQDVIVSAS